MSRALDQADKESFFLVSFVNLVTAEAFARFTTLDSDYVFDGQTYTSETRMTVKLPRNDGTLGEEAGIISIPYEHQFAQDITSGLRYPATLVTVIEIVKGDGAIATDVLYPFRGLMTLARRKLKARARTVTISALPAKARMQTIQLGLPCMKDCVNRLGDGNCKINMGVSPQQITRLVTEINGPRIVVSGTTPTVEDRFYQRGSVVRQGFDFMIREWRAAEPNVFHLHRKPPDSWIGNSVVIFSGCDKSPDTCERRYNNIGQFKGAGIKMPAYHPVYEDGAARQ